MGPYQGLLREAILRMKFAPGEGLAELLAPHWAERMEPRLQPFHPDLVIPVPLHWRRRWQRGFNSNEIFAQALAQRLGIRTVPSWLYRCRPTAQQAGQTSLSARQENVRDAFRARGHEGLQGKTVLLIDDVLTTGATASAAARALKALKPGKILVAVLGHGR